MNEQLPDHERLAEDLRKIFGPDPDPSPEVRARVLEHARRTRPSRRPAWRVPAVAVTLAAAAVLTVMLTRPDAPAPTGESPREKSGAPAEPQMLRAYSPESAGDLNRDGSVNILDAWQLAHALETGRAAPAADLDADGDVGAGDLERLMQRIVRIQGGAS
jgi:hypothetical protein